jgi:hypothetical protein
VGIFVNVPAPSWFVEMLGWKVATSKAARRCVRLFGEAHGPNLADLSSTSSAAIAGRVFLILGVPPTKRTSLDLNAAEDADDASRDVSDEIQTSNGSALERALRSELASNLGSFETSTGSALERALRSDLASHLGSLADSRDWAVTRSGSVSQFAQYTHLAELQRLFEDRPTLRSVLGQNYEISTDVMVSLPDPNDPRRPRVLHAAVSSKLTIRSDRVQNIRYEFGMLVRNRKGRLPHLVVVTGEPLPSRLISIARGTGEIDALYHLLFDEIHQAMGEADLPGVSQRQRDNWYELVDQKRIRPYHELAAVLASG